MRRVLCLGAHSDDIEIGAGATILRLIESVPGVEITWVVFSATSPRDGEARRSASEYLGAVPKAKILIGPFRESFFPTDWAQIKEWFERIKHEFEPDVVLTHFRDDRHQDHRVLSDLAWNTFRNHLILEYEILKYDGDLGRPNVYVPISDEHCRRKIDGLLKYFTTQSGKHWFTRDTFEALHRVRGIECASPTGRAEAFYCRKLVID